MKRTLELAIVSLAALALTAAMTYPLIEQAGTSGRIGLNDGRWSIWIVSWVAHALTSAPWTVLDANIFYPHRQALLFSEPNFGAGLLAVPAWALTGNPILAHNTATLASFVLSATATYYLAKHLTANRRASAVAGIIFAFCPYVFAHTAHIQLLMTAGLPLILLALHRLADRPSIGRGVALGAALAAQALSCGYYGVLGALLAVGGVLFFAAAGRWRDGRYWLSALAGAALCAAIVMPVLVLYLDAQRVSGFGRTLHAAAEYSAVWQSYLASAAWAHRWMVPRLGRFGEVLFPGACALVLAAIGVVAAGRGGPRRKVAIFYALVALFGFWLSLGPAGGLYLILHNTLPVFSFLRAPSRFGLSVTLALAVLSAMGVEAVARKNAMGARVAAVLPAIVAAELFMAPLPLLRMPPVPAPYKMMANLPRGPVAEFPFFATRAQIEFHALYMLWSTYHWQPLINGYSDITPADFGPLSRSLATFPGPAAFDALRMRDTKYIVVTFPRYPPEERLAIAQKLEVLKWQLRLLSRQHDVALYEVVSWEGLTSRGPGGPSF
ncbi:MAG TPA: hypothetical protein VK886_08610 [Vicinamibacterales bacterium]|nr:hypothetical protein [Vicinamibacterales bacterium]